MSLVDAIPQTIKEIGRIRAQGALAKGQWGTSIADIGQMASTIPAQMKANDLYEQQKQQRAQQLQMGSLDLAEKQRQAAANEALGNAFQTSLNPDGTVNIPLLTQHLASNPKTASSIPKIVESLNAMQKSGVDLSEAKTRQGISAEELQGHEADEMGALAHAAEQSEDPNDQAGILLSGIASRVKKGLMTQDEATPIVAGMLGEVQGEGPSQPDPDKVKATIARMKAASKEQRTLADTDTRAAANAENAATSKAQRDEITAERKTKAALTNFSSQLSKTKDAASYARVYQGIPNELKPYFDDPQNWTPESSSSATDVLLTPEQQATKRDRAIAEADRKATAAETARYHKDTVAARREATAAQAGRAGAGTGNASEVRAYNEFTKVWADRYPKPTGGNAFDENGDPKPAPPAPPSLQKWSVMTPAEREKVLSQPTARIDDAEMLRRMGGSVATGGQNPAGGTATPKAPASNAKPGAGKMIKADALAKIAKQHGMSEEDARAQAIEQGYAIVK